MLLVVDIRSYLVAQPLDVPGSAVSRQVRRRSRQRLRRLLLQRRSRRPLPVLPEQSDRRCGSAAASRRRSGSAGATDAVARNGRNPVNSSYMTAPREYRSDARRDLGRLHLLGRHVTRRARDTLDARDVGVAQIAMPKSMMRTSLSIRQHDVAGLDVAMDDAAFVRVVQRFRAFVDDLDDVVECAAGCRAGNTAASVRAP